VKHVTTSCLYLSLASISTTSCWTDRNIHGRKPQFGLEREHVSTALRPGYLQFTNLAYAGSVTEPSHSATMVVKLWAVLVSLEAFTLFPCYRSLGYTSNSTFLSCMDSRVESSGESSWLRPTFHVMFSRSISLCKYKLATMFRRSRTFGLTSRVI